MLSKRSDSGFFPVAVFCAYSTNLFTSNLISAQNKHKADTLGVKDGTEWRRTEECRWTGIRTEGSEEQQGPHWPRPFQLLCSCAVFATIQKADSGKLDPWDERVQTNVPQTTVTQTAFCRGTVKKGKLCIQRAPVDEFATRDQTFAHSVTPSHW